MRQRCCTDQMVSTKQLVLCVLQLAVSAAAAAAADIDIPGVQGFISVSDQFAGESVDLSQLRVEVLNAQGARLFEGAASPNGYYFVPTEPGQYVVRVSSQDGWSFIPEQVQISCGQGPCNSGADVNFQLAGLSLSGHVEATAVADGCNANGGPQLLGHQFVLATPGGRQVAAATTDARGAFLFAGLLPGRYVVTSAASNGVQLQPDSMPHTLTFATTSLPRPFQVAGYTLSGQVSSNSGPVAGIQVLLHSTSPGVSVGCQAQHPAPPGSPASAVCSARSGTDGRYTFQGVPCGTYTLTAQHPSPGSTFDITPEQLTVAVGHASTTAPATFLVTGFSLQGRVVSSGGAGVEGAAVHVNGRPAATTDAGGHYTLTRLQEGQLQQITAVKEGYVFKPLEQVVTSPGSAMLPDIVLEGVAVCGTIETSDAGRAARSRAVKLTSSAGGADKLVNTKADGSFCFTVTPGTTYTVTPVVQPQETAQGFVLHPASQTVAVESAPVQVPAFTQSNLRVRGSIACMGASGCPDDILLQLKGAAGSSAAVFTARLSEVAVADASSSGSSTAFEIPRAAPGTYQLVASRPGWCWVGGAQGVAVAVESKDVQAAPLQQAGYELKLRSSFPADVTITPLAGDTSSAQQSVTLTGSPVSVCLPGVGQWRVAAASCYMFKGADEDNAFVVTTGGSDMGDGVPAPLALEPAAAVLQGAVEVAGVEAPPSSITITAQVTAPGGTTSEHTVTAAAAAGGPPHQLSYSLGVPIGASVALQPQAHPLLVYPLVVRVAGVVAVPQGCPAPVPTINVRPGLVIRGATQPPVEGAEVTFRYKGRSAASSRGTAGQVADTSSTLADGTFSSSMLYDDVAYSVSVSKPGYAFQEQSADPLVFSSRKLSQVGVHVDLPAGEDPQQVFLVFSGDAGFKANARLGPDRRHAFYDTAPGTYYLRPLLKEHSFEPAVATVEVKPGADPEYSFKAVRTAWGISGTVRSIGGQPLAGVVVEAASGPGSVTSAVTDEQGRYRVGRLAPGTYQVAVKLDGLVTSAHPHNMEVVLEEAEAAAHDFTAFRASTISSLTAALQLPPGFTRVLTAQLLPATAASAKPGSTAAAAAVLTSTRVDASGFFELRGLSQGAYVLRVLCEGAASGAACGPWDTPVEVSGPGDVNLGFLPHDLSAGSSSSSKVATPAGSTPRSGSKEPASEQEGAGVMVQIGAGLGLLLLAVLQKDVLVEVFQIGAASSNVPGGGGAAAGGSFTSTNHRGTDGGRGTVSAAAVAAAAAAPLEEEWLPPSAAAGAKAARQRRAQRA